MILRACNKCFELKPLDDFPFGKNYLDNKRPTCKACWSEEMKLRRALVGTSPKKRKLYNTIEKIWILATHGYSIREIFTILTDNPFENPNLKD